MKSLLTVLIAMVAGAAVAAPQGGVQPLPTAPGSELSAGLYYVSKTTTINSTATVGLPGLKVASGKTVAIYIPSGVTLTVNGGNGYGQTGGGAGIEVPINSTLVVTGGGKLEVTGGNAGYGAPGGGGENAEIQWNIENHGLWSGTGGNGGGGGGGAGAAIGGSGGRGGDGGAGADWVYDQIDTCKRAGNNGSAGKPGTGGGACGTVVFMGTLTVTPAFGVAGSGGDGAHGSSWVWFNIGGSNYYGAWGGGGGGGGGGGQRPFYAIGYGGTSGGGGGGGGSGSIYYFGAVNLVANNGWGKGGKQGIGGFVWASGTLLQAESGTEGKSYYGRACKSTSDSNGSGEYGPVSGIFGMWNGEEWYWSADVLGGAGGAGGGGGVYTDVVWNYKGVSISSGVKVNNLEETVYASKDVSTHPAVEYKIVFSDPDKVLLSVPDKKTVYLGMGMPQIDASTTANEAYAMVGWYDAKQGGTRYYDHNGKPDSATYNHYASDLTLYPQVEEAALTPTGVKVNGREIGGEGVEPPAGCVFGVTTRLFGAGPFTLSGENLSGQVRFVVEGSEKVAITLDGLRLKNERKNIGLIDIPAGLSAEITLKGTANYLEATGDSSSAIHCPAGATVKIVGERDMMTIDHKAESTHLRQMILHNDWTVKDVPLDFECDSTTKGETFDLVLKSGSGAAAIGGNRNENCGNITLEKCDLSLTPNGGVLPSDPELARRVHEIGDGLLNASGDLALGGHVTFINVPAIKCPIRTAGSKIDTLTLSRPRPHDEYGVPLTPATMLGDWIVFFRPGVVKVNGDMIGDKAIPRSGEMVRLW